jgi:site-specific DNA-methyltransferase (adenine-specific)
MENSNKRVKLLQGDNMESFKKLPDNSVDSCVTDGPYGLSFMGKKWDYDVPSVEFWKEVYRVLKPGGHVLSFGGTRTYHRMTVNIEDAGFEIRDQIMWLYGSGFPKSHNIGKAVDKLQGNDRVEWLDEKKTQPNIRGNGDQLLPSASGVEVKDREPIKHSKGQSPYEGWGTALKPANEPICVARKPLSEKSIAENVLKWGTGGINIDGCRVGSDIIPQHTSGKNALMGGLKGGDDSASGYVCEEHEGRFPANIILDEIAGELLDEQSGISKSSPRIAPKESIKDPSSYNTGVGGNSNLNDKGGASRFFYQAKVSKAERNMGLEGFDDKEKIGNLSDIVSDSKLKVKNNHPTVKPVSLMAYLCRLVTPPGGIVLDPFMGSGSTGIAAQLEGFRFVGMEMDEDYFKIAEARIENFEKYRKFIK